MGSDVGVRAPPLDSASARARRHLAAARAARDGISTMVDALRISKPPRAPAKPHSASSIPAARRHALIPLAEGRAELEARIHALEDAIAARDADLLVLKRQWGRALVKRRHLENERDAARQDASNMRDALKVSSTAAQAARKHLIRFIDDVASPLPGLRAIVSETGGKDSATIALCNELETVLDDIDEVLSTARDDLERHPLPQMPLECSKLPVMSAAPASVRPRAGPATPSATGSDDDAKSCASFASSAGFGEDRETQISTLIELVDILESKLTAGTPYPSADSSITRAKRTVASLRVRTPAEVSELVAERDQLKAQLDAVMSEKEGIGGEDAAMALAAKAEAELRDANAEIFRMRARLTGVEKIAERAARQDVLMSRHTALEGELRSARKTIERLVQEKNNLRRTALSGGALSNTPSSTKPLAKGTSDAVRRILDWRQRASSENHDDTTDAGAQPCSTPPNKETDNRLPLVPPRAGRANQLPDRPTGVIQGRDPTKKRKIANSDSEDALGFDGQSVSERSLDVGVNDSISAQSLPVRGFLRRHDSFLSAGNVSASGDEITIMNNRNIFSPGGRAFDGLRGLLGEL